MSAPTEIAVACGMAAVARDNTNRKLDQILNRHIELSADVPIEKSFIVLSHDLRNLSNSLLIGLVAVAVQRLAIAESDQAGQA